MAPVSIGRPLYGVCGMGPIGTGYCILAPICWLTTLLKNYEKIQLVGHKNIQVHSSMERQTTFVGRPS